MQDPRSRAALRQREARFRGGWYLALSETGCCTILPGMSIVTKTGDQGTTALMYNRRVAKNHPRVEAYGTVDELNAALGLARATTSQDFARGCLASVQQDLITLMGELATSTEDLARYVKDGYVLVRPEMTARLENVVAQIEAQNVKFSGWAVPGGNISAAALDVARTVCRRAERCVCALHQKDQPQNPEIIVYLNRLSDLLWLLARWEEQGGAHGNGSKSNHPE